MDDVPFSLKQGNQEPEEMSENMVRQTYDIEAKSYTYYGDNRGNIKARDQSFIG